MGECAVSYRQLLGSVSLNSSLYEDADEERRRSKYSPPLLLPAKNDMHAVAWPEDARALQRLLTSVVVYGTEHVAA